MYLHNSTNTVDVLHPVCKSGKHKTDTEQSQPDMLPLTINGRVKGKHSSWYVRHNDQLSNSNGTCLVSHYQSWSLCYYIVLKYQHILRKNRLMPHQDIILLFCTDNILAHLKKNVNRENPSLPNCNVIYKNLCILTELIIIFIDKLNINRIQSLFILSIKRELCINWTDPFWYYGLLWSCQETSS